MIDEPVSVVLKRFVYALLLAPFVFFVLAVIFGIYTFCVRALFGSGMAGNDATGIGLIIYSALLFLVFPYRAARTGKYPGVRWFFFMASVFICILCVSAFRSAPLSAIIIVFPFVVFLAGDLGERKRKQLLNTRMDVEDRSSVVRRVNDMWDGL